jgi:hypothetical protein
MSYFNRARFDADPIYREYIRAQRRATRQRYRDKLKPKVVRPMPAPVWESMSTAPIRVGGMELNSMEARLLAAQLVAAMPARVRPFVLDRYMHDMSFNELGADVGLTGCRIDQLVTKGLRAARFRTQTPPQKMREVSVTVTPDNTWVEKHARRIERAQRGPGYLVRRRFAHVLDEPTEYTYRWMINHPNKVPRHLRDHPGASS